MSPPWRPGLNVYRAADMPAWRPCLTRARGENDQPLVWEHAWFLDVGGTGYCFACRGSRPRAVFGPEWWTEEIRAAMERGDQRRVRELVDSGPTKVDEKEDGDPVLVHRDLKPVNALAISVDENSKPSPDSSAVAVMDMDVHGYAGEWTRRRTDVYDVDAIDPVYAQVWFGTSAREWDEFVVERAAIFEYLGGIPRPVAEVKARQLGGARPREGARK